VSAKWLKMQLRKMLSQKQRLKKKPQPRAKHNNIQKIFRAQVRYKT
jgi:hypothetical protein